jgi:hypothetical protein
LDAAEFPVFPPIAIGNSCGRSGGLARGRVHARLERLIRSEHDAGDPASKTGRGGNPMLQRALPVPHPNIALGERPRAYELPQARTLVRVFIGQALRFCRWLGRLAAAGGPLS